MERDQLLPMIPASVIEDLKFRNSIEDVIGLLCAPEAGRAQFEGLLSLPQ